ncbi:MAG: response regulator transcription factor [Fimbriimonas sp.]|nr:response regulator transcription factor [Fimbriimonas sp.]
MKLLIVDDDPQIGAALRAGFDEVGFYSQICRDGNRALHLAMSTHFTAIVLDLMLPGMNGIEVCRQLRMARIQVPILMLTARDAVPDRVSGLDAGADDYLCKPFEFSELLARIRALVRRDSSVKQTVLDFGDLQIDTARRLVRWAGQPVDLTPREYSLLEALAAHEGRTLTRDAIVDRIWFNDGVASNIVDVYVRSLRRKVDRNPAHKLIHTVYGIGYVFGERGETTRVL